MAFLNVWRLGYCILLGMFSASSVGVAYAGAASTLPLVFNPSYGYYTLPLTIGTHPPQKIYAVVDTGSSNLNLIGDERLCPHCTAYGDIQRFSLTPGITPLNSDYTIGYMLGEGQLSVYRAPLLVGQQLLLTNYRFSVYRKGSNVDNIVGFGTRGIIASPKGMVLPTLFEALDRAYGFNGKFTLLLRGNRGGSHIVFGDPPALKLGKRHAYDYHGDYAIQHSGVYDLQGRPVCGVGDPKQVKHHAILDSGTTGRFFYPPKAHAAIVSYVRQHNSGKNRGLPLSFWSSNGCVPQAHVNLKVFPTLKLGFVADDDSVRWVLLRPSDYVVHSGCDSNSYRFAFAAFFPYKGKQPLAASPVKKSLAIIPDVILGTPLFERLAVTFDLHHRKLIF